MIQKLMTLENDGIQDLDKKTLMFCSYGFYHDLKLIKLFKWVGFENFITPRTALKNYCKNM